MSLQIRCVWVFRVYTRAVETAHRDMKQWVRCKRRRTCGHGEKCPAYTHPKPRRFPPHGGMLERRFELRKKHMAYRKKYKPCILKYKALISKYMPYIFRDYKCL